MGVYLRAKFEVSSIILTGFRQGGGDNFTLPPPQNKPLKSPPRLGLRNSYVNLSLCDSFFKDCIQFENYTKDKLSKKFGDNPIELIAEEAITTDTIEMANVDKFQAKTANLAAENESCKMKGES